VSRLWRFEFLLGWAPRAYALGYFLTRLRRSGSGEEDLGFGFDDEEGVGGGVAGVAELLEGFVEGGGLDGKDYGAVLAADEVEAAFLLDELEVGGHGRALAGARLPT